MDSDTEQAFERLEQAVALLRRQLDAAPPAMPGHVPWLSLDGEGRVTELTEAAAARLGLADDAPGTRLDEMLVLEGNPLRGGVVRARIEDREVPLFSVVQETGACLVIGSGEPGSAMDRKIVHDLANVLAVVRGRAEMAAMDEVPDRVRASMQEIMTAVDRVRSLLGA